MNKNYYYIVTHKSMEISIHNKVYYRILDAETESERDKYIKEAIDYAYRNDRLIADFPYDTYETEEEANANANHSYICTPMEGYAFPYLIIDWDEIEEIED